MRSGSARAEVPEADASSVEHGIWRPFRSLLAAQVAAALLGLVFWVLSARLVPPRELGTAAAAISLQTVLGIVTVLGLGTMLVSELRQHPPVRQRTMVRRSLLVVAVFSAVVGAVVVALHDWLSTNLREALGDPVGGVAFVLGVIAAGWALIVDDSALAIGRSQVQVARNLLASALRFPLVIALLSLGFDDAHAIQLCWVLPLLVSMPVALWRLKLPRGDQDSPRLRADVASYMGLALRNHALSLTLSSASQLIPVVAAVTLTSVGNAEFAIAWLIATFVFLPPYLLSTALFAHGASVSTEEFRRGMARTLPASLILSGVLCLGAWTLGEPVLLIFGGPYARESWLLLAILAPAGLWMLFKDHLVALWRSQRRFALATRLAGAGLVIEVGGAIAGAVLGGTVGLCVGWLSAMLIEVVLAAPLLRQAFGGLRWRWPTLVQVRGGQAGQVSLRAVALIVLVLIMGAAGAWSLFGSSTQHAATRSPDAAELDVRACQVGSGRPGPFIDLGVQAATGRPSDPVLSTAQVDQLVGRAQQAGAQVISTTASFRALQPSAGSAYRYTATDRVIAAARSAGLAVHLKITGVPTWAMDDPADPARQPPESAAELARWTTFLGDLMQHVGNQVAYVEIWTQPNTEKYWPSGPDPEQFVRLLAASYDVVHRYAPDTQVISGGLLGNDVGYLEKMYAAVHTLGLARPPFDLLGVQPFTGSAAPDDVDPARVDRHAPFGTYDDNFTGYTMLHDVMVDHGEGATPIYISDFGYSTLGSVGVPPVPDATRARYLSEAFGITTCSPYVAGFSWYALVPNHWDTVGWTLLNAAGEPTQTYTALARWAADRAARPAGATR